MGRQSRPMSKQKLKFKIKKKNLLSTKRRKDRNLTLQELWPPVVLTQMFPGWMVLP
jgi:hypothetical protein